MPPRPAPDTPFTEEDLARLPQWAQRKVTWLSGQLARALELAGQADRDTPTESATERADADSLANAGRRALPVGLTVSDEGDVLNWEGINYRRLDLTVGLSRNPDTAAQAGTLEAEGLFLAVSTLARIASLANEGLDALPGAEGVGDDD